jgi:hypothetical protein
MSSDLDLNVKVDVSGERDVDKLGDSFEKTGKKADGLSGKTMALASSVGAFVGGAALQLAKAGLDYAIDKIGDSIDLASNKAESASKVNVLYGKSAAIIEANAANAATSVALSSGAYLEAAGTLGNLTRGMGVGEKQSADMSVSMIQLAADMGSFSNADPSDVLAAMTSALAGQNEPLRKYGVLLNEATIKATAMEMGLYDGVGAISSSARAQAVYQAMLDQTGKAQGDLARTSDGLANKQRIAAAKQEEAWTRLGEAIMPLAAIVMPALADAITFVVTLVVDAIAAVQDWVRRNQALVDAVVKVANVLLNILGKAIGFVVKAVGFLIDAWTAEANAFLALFRLITNIGGKIFGPLIDGIRTVIRWTGDLWSSVSSTAAKISNVLGAVFEPFAKGLQKAISIVTSAWNAFAKGWNSIGISIPSVKIPNPLGGDITVGGGRLDLPHLPVLDSGGIVTGPTLAMLAANSRPEAIVPLDRMPTGITVNVYAGVGDPVAIGREIVAAVRAFERANGPAWAPAA